MTLPGGGVSANPAASRADIRQSIGTLPPTKEEPLIQFTCDVLRAACDVRLVTCDVRDVRCIDEATGLHTSDFGRLDVENVAVV